MQKLKSCQIVCLFIFVMVYALQAQDESLVAYWTFDDSTAYDSSGYEHHGTVFGDPQIIPGKKGNAIQFDGVDDYIRVFDTDLLDTDTTMTLALWIKPDSITSGGAKFMSKWQTAPTEGDWLCSLSSVDSCSGACVSWYMVFANYHVISADSAWVSIAPTDVDCFFQLHRWSFVAVTFDSGHVKAYFNGQFINERYALYMYTSLEEYASDDIYIGQYHRRDRPQYNFNGGLDEIRLYNRALSADEIITLYQQAAAIEDAHISGQTAGDYFLAQNYPNPFNPSTNIEVTLPKSEFVELKVYNILGEEVSTLALKKLNQGNHAYTFDGKNMASGIYYYQLVAGAYRDVKKMILLR